MKTNWFKIFLLILITGLSWQCRKDRQVDCVNPLISAAIPYSEPVWYPSGKSFVFNYSPVAKPYKVGSPPCEFWGNDIYPDSVGFYFMNADGTGLKRLSHFIMYGVAWSPDENWLAFSFGDQIYKMPFTGTGFDSTRMIQLTDSGKNFNPSWSIEGDTIFYDSGNYLPNGNYFSSIWKMANDGSGKTMVRQPTDTAFEEDPVVGTDNRVYFVRISPSDTAQIFSMDKEGFNVKQITFMTSNSFQYYHRYFNGNVFYYDAGYLCSTSTAVYAPHQLLLCDDVDDFDITLNGLIICTLGGFALNDSRYGTFWTANADGSDTSQLTFNHY